MPGAANVTVASIVVGEAEIRIANSNLTANVTEFNSANLKSVGGTQGGVEISWEPDMVDIEVDQFGDAAMVIQSKVKVMLKTTMAEASLKNLALAWNFDNTDPGTDVVANNEPGFANTKTFLFGVQSVYPFEKMIQVVGTAPGTTATTTKTRKFNTKRAISMESSSLSFKRAEASTFAVGFRILPVAADTGYEYGKIIDEV